MWTCNICGRVFIKTKQPHSCKKVPFESHFKNKELAKELFSILFKRIEKNIGKCKIVSLPCCVHLFGTYDFLAVLPKKDSVEIRFALDRQLTNPKLTASISMSSKIYKNCFRISTKKEIDGEFIGWLKDSYHLKD